MRKYRRIAIALLIGATVFGAAYAAAASLGVDGSQLQAGVSVEGSCQSGNLTTSVSTSYANGTTGYKVGTVTVGGLTRTACDSKSMAVTLTKSDGTQLGTTLTVGTSTSGNVLFDFSSQTIAASDLGKIFISIS